MMAADQAQDERIMPPGHEPAMGERTSGWAIAALICSLALFCPPLTILSPLLAVKALHHIKTTPGRKGRGLAILALVLGGLTTLGWGWGAWWWNGNIRQPMIRGPVEAFRAGWSGDLEGFKSGFFGDGAISSDEEAGRFLSELDARYGRLLAMSQRKQQDADLKGYQMQGYRITYLMTFEMGPINAEGRFVIKSPDHFWLIGRFAWFAVFDEEQSYLVYPSSAAEEAFRKKPPDAHPD